MNKMMSTSKYFIAVVIPSPLFGQIEAIKQELFLKFGLKGALRSPAHITLHMPFEWRAAREPQLIETLRRFTFEQQFTIALSGFGFFEPRVAFVNIIPLPQLDDLQRSLVRFAAAELKIYNQRDDLRGFHPHVTVAFRDLKKRDFHAIKAEFDKRAFAGEFSFEGFSLLRLDDKWKVIREFRAE